MNSSKKGESAPVNYNPGSNPLDGAPAFALPNGNNCVPQFYCTYSHDVNSVRKLVENITFEHALPVFVGDDGHGVFVQVGVIGHENYDRSQSPREKKTVYGRKWRVEKNLPAAEIVQTIFLAFKKSLEHEVREFFTFEHSSGAISTPFNNHHDVSLMSEHPELVEGENELRLLTLDPVDAFVSCLKFDQRSIDLVNVEQRKNGDWLLDFALGSAKEFRAVEGEMSHYEGAEFSIILQNLDANQLLFELMEQLIKISDRFVEEKFCYCGFKRFSRTNDVEKIGELSVFTRSMQHRLGDAEFKERLVSHNYEVDASRVPMVELGGES